MTLREGIQHNLYKISKAWETRSFQYLQYIHYFWIFSEPAALNKYYCTLISPFFGMVCTMM